MDVLLKPKKLRQKRLQKKKLWLFRLSKHSPKKKEALVKYARRMQRYAKRRQLVDGQFYCKAGKPITQERVSSYEAMCHFMVAKFLPQRALWEASMVYEDLINQCRIEVMLALLNGFDPKKVMGTKVRTPEEFDHEVQMLEQTIVFGRLKSYLRRQRWKYHPEQLGGRSSSLEGILDGVNQEFGHGLFTSDKTDPLIPVDKLNEQKDRLLNILKNSGPEAVKKAFFRLDNASREHLGDFLWSEDPRRSGLGQLEECEEECSSV